MNKQISKVYLVKWQDLSYKDLTWETENNINPREKIDQFLRNNRLSLKEKLTGQLTNIKLHNILLQNSEDKEARNKLYHLEDVKQKQSIIFGSKNMPIFKNNRRLKSFQLQSLNWLVKNWCQGRNSILADEMGLGKTIQSIAFLQYLSTHEQMNGPFLVLAPLTTLHQWRKQFEEWTNMNCLLYYD